MPQRLAISFIGALALLGCAQAQGGSAPPAIEPPAPMPTTHPAPPSDSAKPEPGVASPSPAPSVNACGADKLADYVNQLPSPEAMTSIQAAVGHNRIRTIRPGEVVTMDFREDRLNVEIGADGRIKLFRCG